MTKTLVNVYIYWKEEKVIKNVVIQKPNQTFIKKRVTKTDLSICTLLKGGIETNRLKFGIKKKVLMTRKILINF